MNKTALLLVADAIEKHSIADLGFNMADWADDISENYPDLSGHYCGTTACIAGYTIALLDSDGALRSSPLNANQLRRVVKDIFDDDNSPGVQAIAEKTLGLSRVQSEALFRFRGDRSAMGQVTPAEAVAELRRLAAEVD